MRAILSLLLVGCGTVSDNRYIDDARGSGSGSACEPETDAVFCTRVDSTCETVANTDNCGEPRTADCGTCMGTDACEANVCKAPVCGTTFAASGTIVESLYVTRQTALAGASATGQSVLYLQTPLGACGGFQLFVADEAAANTPPYVAQPLANLGGFSKAEETIALAPDGLTIIGASTGGATFVESKRSAIGAGDFSQPVTGDFVTLDAALPPAPANVRWPVLSADGLAFYYRVAGATVAAINGQYESLRTSTAMPFPAGTRMPAAVQALLTGSDGISGMSSDRMTAFVAVGFGTKLLTRTSLSQPFIAPAASTPPAAAYRVVPISGCTAIGTCEPGGCQNEAICTWTNH